MGIDAERKVILINKKGCKILGYKKDEIIRKDRFENFLPEAINDEISSVFQKILDGKLKLVEFNENPVLSKSSKERLI